MNGIQHAKMQNLEKPFPGCLGKMVNLFDLSSGLAKNRLLSDKPHYDGSRTNMEKMPSFGDQTEDKVMVSDLRRASSTGRLNGTPMKMLIAQEMANELQSNQNPPNLVAKLMGLDTLPHGQPDAAAERSNSRGYSRSHSRITSGCWQLEHGCSEVQIQPRIHEYTDQNRFKDFYEIWQLSEKVNFEREKLPLEGLCNDNDTNENRMALVRQKFTEAKRLATDEKLRQSKQFQDALEVLSCNRDLFLKFLQEPNSLFSQHLYDSHSISPSLETKRITILKPSKMVNNERFVKPGKRNEKESKKVVPLGQLNGWNNPGCSPPLASWKVDDNVVQPTRIVVLKPSLGKSVDTKDVIAAPSSLPAVSQCEDINEVPEDEAQELREVSEDMKCQMQENMSEHQRDETVFSSIFSSGYIGDGSSFNKSEIDYAAGNFCDSEVVSPTSRYSWDYVNRFGSPYTSSSFSRASYSPESSVCREAKKRLSERWAIMASNGSGQEQRHVRRSSSTLGEMLAISDMKKSLKHEEQCHGGDHEPKESSAFSTDNLIKTEGADASPRNLLRSKSVPLSSTMYGTQLVVEVSDCKGKKVEVSKEVKDARAIKTSFKEKVSSLFFSRNKKSVKSITNASQSSSGAMTGHGDVGRADSSLDLHGTTELSSQDLVCKEQKQVAVIPPVGSSLIKSLIPGNAVENQDHRSPVSVLEASFEEDAHTTKESSGNIILERHAVLPLNSNKSNLIDKSPPIGSIARTLTWDDSCVDTATSYSSTPPLASQGAEEERQEMFFFVQTVLSAAGLDGEVQMNSIMSGWYSPECPLDPSLRDKYAFPNDKETLHEAKRRQRRSTRKLVFDFVNAVLVEIAGYESDACQRSISCGGSYNGLKENSSLLVVDLVWGQIKKWFSGEVRCVPSDGGDFDSLVVESLVRKEVVGIGWVEQSRLEIDNLQKEIERKLVEELFNEAVIELINRY